MPWVPLANFAEATDQLSNSGINRKVERVEIRALEMPLGLGGGGASKVFQLQRAGSTPMTLCAGGRLVACAGLPAAPLGAAERRVAQWVLETFPQGEDSEQTDEFVLTM